MRALLALVALGRRAAATTCAPLGPLGTSSSSFFCTGVTWNASLPLAASALDTAARTDFDAAVDRLRRLGGAAALPMCLESWKALQCASKFPKCSAELPTQRVCRSLCMQFADACNGSEAVLARCADDTLYDEPPCTDYAELPPLLGTVRWMAVGGVPPPAGLSSSPAELFHTAAGLPLLLALAVLLAHVFCCALQSACGSGDDSEGSGAFPTPSPRDALRDALAPPRPDMKAPLMSR